MDNTTNQPQRDRAAIDRAIVKFNQAFGRQMEGADVAISMGPQWRIVFDRIEGYGDTIEAAADDAATHMAR